MVMSLFDPDAVRARAAFDSATAAAGLTLPADNLEVLFVGYQDIQRMAALVRSARPAAAEPANIFDPRTIGRKDGR
jgi:hypothetical protein